MNKIGYIPYFSTTSGMGVFTCRKVPLHRINQRFYIYWFIGLSVYVVRMALPIHTT